MSSPSGRHQDKVAVITGGGSGLGRALCLDLAGRGAIAVVTDINLALATQVAETVVAAGGRSIAMQLDVTQAEQVAVCLAEVVTKYGHLDYYFNNAGIITLGEVRDMALEHWHKLIDVNFMGVLYGTLAAYSHMVRQGSGHIVNISSVGGLIPMPTYTAYAVTKHAVVALSNSLRSEGSGLGVRVSVACPGMMATGLGDAATILHAKREDVHNPSWKKKAAMDPALAARLILHGVERNQAMIVFPFSSRLLWWIYRMRPAFLAPFEAKMLTTFRRIRSDV